MEAVHLTLPFLQPITFITTRKVFLADAVTHQETDVPSITITKSTVVQPSVNSLYIVH